MVLNLFSKLFGKKVKTLDDLTLDDLRRERVALESELRQHDQTAVGLDRDERQLKSEFAATEDPMLERSIARKVQEVRTRRKGVDTRVAYCLNMLQSVNGFIVIKENSDFFERMGVDSVLANMDVADVQQFVSGATVEGQLILQTLTTMLEGVLDGVDALADTTRDLELDDIVEELKAETGDVEPENVKPTEEESDDPNK